MTLSSGPMPGTTPLQHRPRVRRRLVAHAERHDRDQRLEALVGVVGHRVDPADAGELAEPEVALLLARAQEEVAARELLVEHLDRDARHVTRRSSARGRAPARAPRGGTGRRCRRRRSCRCARATGAACIRWPWKIDDVAPAPRARAAAGRRPGAPGSRDASSSHSSRAHELARRARARARARSATPGSPARPSSAGARRA